MLILTSAMLVIWKLDGLLAETPYHYINQVPATTPEILTPKPLFSPHDVRRENVRPSTPINSYQTGIVRGQGNQPGYSYGSRNQLQNSQNVPHQIHGDSSGAFSGDQRIWYPIYADVQHPAWVDLNQAVPYDLSYGPLPEGYAPKIPLRGDPLGYSFSYSAGDHSRHDISDGRGNFFSSFSLLPSADSVVLQSNGIPTLDYGIVSTNRPVTVNIPSLNPGPYSTVTPIHHSFNPSIARPLVTTPSPLDVPTARPIISSIQGPSNTDFTNGFYFSANNYPSNRIPQRPLNVNSHPLSTNIQYDSLVGQSALQPSIAPSSSRREIVKPLESRKVTTERSYQTLSRSLPLAFSTQRFDTGSTPFTYRTTTERYYSSPTSRRTTELDTRIFTSIPRSAARRSTTERYISYGNRQRSTTLSTSSTQKPSVVQKIPRKPKNNFINYNETDSRPTFIDDLTSLAYSTSNTGNMNDTIIQIKPRRDKKISQLPDGKEKIAIQEKSSITDYLMNSSRTLESGGKDGHVSGNKTYLAGLGLRSNIHY